MVLSVVIGVEAPFCALMGHATGHPAPFWLLAAVLTGAFLFTTFTGGRNVWGAPGRVRLYLVLWPFFAWWTLSLVFSVLAPLAYLAGRLAHAPSGEVWGVAFGLAVAGTLLAFRGRPRIRRHEIAIPGLPEAFDGFRVAQISDLHCGPFASGARVEGWVAEVNALGADLVAVTGDLIASGPSFVPVVAAALGKLRGRDGVVACMGNHDYFTEGEIMVHALERAGLTLLRNRGIELRRGDATLYVAGVDDTWTGRDDLDEALAGRPAQAPVLLLAHDPALFPDAAARAVALTLSGHTHGGQLGVPLLAKRINLARVMTPFTTGLYQIGQATLYVNRGLGTTGMPIRLSVPPEIAVITLRRAPATAAAAAPQATSPVSEGLQPA